MKKLHPRALFLLWNHWFWSYLGIIIILNFYSFSLAFSVKNNVTAFGFNPFWSILVALVLSFIWARLSYERYKYELTETALKIEKGVIWKRYVSIPYDRIQNVDIYRGILARLLGLSDLQVQTAGQVQGRGYNLFAEGRLIGLDKELAEKLRDDLLKHIKSSRQGL